MSYEPLVGYRDVSVNDLCYFHRSNGSVSFGKVSSTDEHSFVYNTLGGNGSVRIHGEQLKDVMIVKPSFVEVMPVRFLVGSNLEKMFNLDVPKT